MSKKDDASPLKGQYILNRNFTLATKMGHVIRFIKGEPTYVPPVCRHEAQSIGAVPADGSDPQTVDEKPNSPAPASPEERNALILEAIKDIQARNEREEFTAAGSPHPDVVSRILKFKVTQREIAAVLQKYNEDLALNQG